MPQRDSARQEEFTLVLHVRVLTLNNKFCPLGVRRVLPGRCSPQRGAGGFRGMRSGTLFPTPNLLMYAPGHAGRGTLCCCVEAHPDQPGTVGRRAQPH